MLNIRDHGGQYGGSGTKKMFHKRDGLSLPVVKRKFPSWRTFADARRYKNVYIISAWSNGSNTINFITVNSELNQVATLDSWRDYSTFNGVFSTLEVSEKLGKVFSIYSTTGNYGLCIRDISDAGITTNEKYLILGVYSSMAQTLVLDHDADLLYCVWGSTLYCFDMKTLTNTSVPIWTASVLRPNKMIKVGDKLYSFSNTESRSYTLTGSGAVLHKTSTAKSDSGSDVLTDGTYIYALYSDGTIVCLDLELNVVGQTSNSYLVANPTGYISRAYAHSTNRLGLVFVDSHNLYVRTENTIIVLNKFNFDFVDERMIAYDTKNAANLTSFTLDEYKRTPLYDTKNSEIIGSMSQVVSASNVVQIYNQLSRFSLKY